MTLDEAIQECIKDAQRITEGFYDDDGNWCHDPEIGDKCIQVAEWLKELKKYRAIFKKVGESLANNGYTIDDLYAIYVKTESKEVNADEEIHS